jgi:transposase
MRFDLFMNVMTIEANNLTLENSKLIETRHEMILAHTKFGKSVRTVIKEYNVSTGSYYHWFHRYKAEGIMGLINRKPGAKAPYNKISMDIETEIVHIAKSNKELDAGDIRLILCENYGFNQSIFTVQRALLRHGLNRPRGKRSKKTIEKKREKIQSQRQIA